jgi:hypothetical protein
MNRGQFTEGATALRFMLAGHARITLVSAKTGQRFTFRISKPRDAQRGVPAPLFVALLRGPDNGSDFQFLGTIFHDRRYSRGTRDGSAYVIERPFVLGKKSRIAANAPSALAFVFAWKHIERAALPPDCEVWHEGKCGCCGRALTVPESIASGIGPICAQRGT